MTCLLAERDRHLYESRASWSFCSEPPRAGWFRLFNKNALRTTFVRVIGQADTEHGWIVEARAPIDPYFKQVLRVA